MKVLITQQFNERMKSLSSGLKSEVIKLFNFASHADKSEIFNQSLTTKIVSDENDIFTLRGKDIRVFFSYDYKNEKDEIIFLDISSVNEISKRRDVPKGDTTFFGKSGEPTAYLAHQDDSTIYTFDGTPCAYIKDINNIYGFNGKHLGWFEEDIIFDHFGNSVAFTKKTCPSFTMFEPFKGFKQFKPFKGFTEIEPLKPLKSAQFSNVNLLDLLKSGR